MEHRETSNRKDDINNNFQPIGNITNDFTTMNMPRNIIPPLKTLNYGPNNVVRPRMDNPRELINPYQNYNITEPPRNITSSDMLLNCPNNSNSLQNHNINNMLIAPNHMLHNGGCYINIPTNTNMNAISNIIPINRIDNVLMSHHQNQSFRTNNNQGNIIQRDPNQLINDQMMNILNHSHGLSMSRGMLINRPSTNMNFIPSSAITTTKANLYNNNRPQWNDFITNNAKNNCYCNGCVTTQDCGICAVCITMHKFGGPFITTSKSCNRRRCIASLTSNTFNRTLYQDGSNTHEIDMNNTREIRSNQVATTENKLNIPQPGCSMHSIMKPLNISQQNHPYIPTPNVLTNDIGPISCINKLSPSLRTTPITNQRNVNPQTKMIRIKFGLYCCAVGCKNICLPKSKFCSQQCGVNHNLKRLSAIIPELSSRINIHNYTSHKHDEMKIIAIQNKLKFTTQKMEHNKLLRSKLFEYFDNRPNFSSHLNTRVSNLYDFQAINQFTCVCCGVNFAFTNITKHMELCFTKIEKIYSYFTPVQSHQVFMCDKHLKKQDGYCKRLFSNCVDHKNLDKFQSNIICGFFLESDNHDLYCDSSLLEKYDNACNIPREKCVIHFGWERTRLANVEQILQNLNIYIKSLNERLVDIRIRMKNRKSLIDKYLGQS